MEQTDKDALKAKFGMPNVTHYDDVAATRTSLHFRVRLLLTCRAVRNQLWTWQSLSPASGGAIFYDFCDALEMQNGTAAGPNGWGLEHALDAWGAYETLAVDGCKFVLFRFKGSS